MADAADFRAIFLSVPPRLSSTPENDRVLFVETSSSSDCGMPLMKGHVVRGRNTPFLGYTQHSLTLTPDLIHTHCVSEFHISW